MQKNVVTKTFSTRRSSTGVVKRMQKNVVTKLASNFFKQQQSKYFK